MSKWRSNAGGSWLTKQVYTLKHSYTGHIISERTNSAWTTAGMALAWSDRWYHYDLLGNTSSITDAGGMLSGAIEMDAFGNHLNSSVTAYTATTKLYDAESALYFFGARWFDPALGLFYEPSPFAPKWEGPFLYCNNSPTVLVDPSGLLSVNEAAGMCASGSCEKGEGANKRNCCAFARCIVTLLDLDPPTPIDFSDTEFLPWEQYSPGEIFCYGQESACRACLNGDDTVGLHIGVMNEDGAVVNCRGNTVDQYPYPWEHWSDYHPPVPPVRFWPF